MDTPRRRRSVLKLLGAAAGAATIGSVVHATASEHDAERTFVLEQGEECIELVPLSGAEPVESFYDYRYPTNMYDSIAGSNGYTFSSHGTADLQKDATSVLFLYDGPEGLSLVVVHGRLDGDDDGGVVTLTFDGMPEDASWIVKDDLYLVDGEPADTNYDQWNEDGTTHQVDWAYTGGRTDGGVAHELGEDFEITIDPAFNEEAALAQNHDDGPIEYWEAVSEDGESTERVPLQMDEPVTVRAGTCEDPAEDDPDDEPTDTPDDEPTDTPDDDPVDDPTDTPNEEDGTDEEDAKGC